jgi:carboxylesterase
MYISLAMTVELSKEMRAAQQGFAFTGAADNNVGVLCVHGFTGSPAEMHPLGAYLAQAGFTAVGPVLPQHGGMPHELKGAKWRDWVAAAHDALNQLAERCERVFVAGLSMGGLITLHLAACECHRASKEGRRTPICGVIIMAAPTSINDSRARLVKYARHVVPYYYPFKNANFDDPTLRANLQRRTGADNPVNFDDPGVRKAIVKSVRIPLSAIHELMQLNEVVMRELPRVHVPALFFQGRKDTVVAPGSADNLASRLGSQDKRVVWYANSAHELPLEPDAPAMFDEIQRFIQAHI